jgi:hypothetical protein
MTNIALNLPAKDASQLLAQLADLWKKNGDAITPELQNIFVTVMNALLDNGDGFITTEAVEEWWEKIEAEEEADAEATGTARGDPGSEISPTTAMMIAKVSALLKMPPDDLSPDGALWSNNSEEPMIILTWTPEVTASINHHLPPMVAYALRGICAEQKIKWENFCPEADLGDDEDDGEEINVAVPDPDSGGSPTRH